MTPKRNRNSGTADIVDYEQLLAEYRQGLVDTLRGFAPSEEYLESWVPDEDIVISLCNMVEAAASSGEEAISVFVNNETAKTLDRQKFFSIAQELGEVQIIEKTGGLSIGVRAIGGGRLAPSVRPGSTGVHREIEPQQTQPRQASIKPQEIVLAAVDTNTDRILEETSLIGPCYRDAVENRRNCITKDKVPAEKSGTVLVEGVKNGISLNILVDPQTHLIERAGHQGATLLVTQALLDELCQLIEGRPIQDASDHGIIELEAKLRDYCSLAPVPGIIAPENADMAFYLPLMLIRSALNDYRERFNYRSTENEYYLGPSPEWLCLSGKQREEIIIEAFRKICADNDISPEDVRFVNIEDQVRVVISFSRAVEPAGKQRYMMVFEFSLKRTIDKRIELFLEELMDENKIRRLDQGRKKHDRND